METKAKNGPGREFPGTPVVQSLVRELRSHMPHVLAKKKFFFFLKDGPRKDGRIDEFTL